MIRAAEAINAALASEPPYELASQSQYQLAS